MAGLAAICLNLAGWISKQLVICFGFGVNRILDLGQPHRNSSPQEEFHFSTRVAGPTGAAGFLEELAPLQRHVGGAGWGASAESRCLKQTMPVSKFSPLGWFAFGFLLEPFQT